jgi:hypothetical protein
MIGMVQAEHASTLKQAETNNKQQPTNQNGTRSGPKKSTESVQESAKWLMQPDSIKKTREALELFYAAAESDTVQAIQKYKEKQSFPIGDLKSVTSSVYFSKERMMHVLEQQTTPLFMRGVEVAKEHAARKEMPKLNYELASQTIRTEVKEAIDHLEGAIFSLLQERLAKANNAEQAILAARATFQSLRHRVNSIASYYFVKSYNYGYALALKALGESEVVAVYEAGECPTCMEKAGQPIPLNQLSSLDEVAIFYRIPSWHPHCECHLSLNKGGEES